MNKLSEHIKEKYIIRHTKQQKADFREFMLNELSSQGHKVSIQSGKNSFIPVHNIIIGDIDNAKYLVTAHYDTPNTSLFPVVMFADSFWLSVFATFLSCMPIILIGYISGNLSAKYNFNPILSILPIYAALILGMFTFTNKNNYNDNTSGVISVLEIFYSLPEEVRNKGAFILFDNEEKGLIGSGFLKLKLKNKKIPVYNLDCVGDGDEIRLFAKKNILFHAQEIASLAETNSQKSVKVTQRALKNMLYMSDDYTFDNAICFAAFRSSPFGKYVGRIHTNRDKILDEENIAVIRESMSEFLCKRYS